MDHNVGMVDIPRIGNDLEFSDAARRGLPSPMTAGMSSVGIFLD
jgi:hypothetical protein